MAEDILRRRGSDCRVLILASPGTDGVLFADALEERLEESGVVVVETVKGQAPDVARAFQRLVAAGETIDVIACSTALSTRAVVTNRDTRFPALGASQLFTPESYRWPTFLNPRNLLDVADQIAVTAIIAIGMTMVIVTAGIDLSVGSLIALSSVVAAWLIRELAGAEAATASGMAICCLGAVGVCAALGAFSGVMVTAFSLPPFIVTLSMMLVARGLAYTISDSQSIYQLPEAFTWLARGADILGIPNAVVLMFILYVIAHIVMGKTPLGRYVYAVGGNREAARLSGVPVRRVLLFVYTLCGALGGLGGILIASQFKSGSPKYGLMYELDVIAAVVVGGTSLAGGEGKIFGTLIGAFIIAVIRNGMNLMELKSEPQQIVLGLVILGAILLDTLKKRGWRRNR